MHETHGIGPRLIPFTRSTRVVFPYTFCRHGVRVLYALRLSKDGKDCFLPSMTCRNILCQSPGMDLFVTKKPREEQRVSNNYLVGRRLFGTKRADPLRCASTRGFRVD